MFRRFLSWLFPGRAVEQAKPQSRAITPVVYRPTSPPAGTRSTTTRTPAPPRPIQSGGFTPRTQPSTIGVAKFGTSPQREDRDERPYRDDTTPAVVAAVVTHDIVSGGGGFYSDPTPSYSSPSNDSYVSSSTSDASSGPSFDP